MLLQIANRVADRVAPAATCGLPTVLTVDEKTAIEDLLVYPGRHCLGIARRRVTWDPLRGPGEAWFTTFFKRHPRLTLRVSANDHARLDVFYDTWQEVCDKVQP